MARHSSDEGTELFLKYLPHSADEDSIWAHFESLKSLQSVRLQYDRVTGESKGIGWITLSDAAEADQVVNEWNQWPHNHMDGRNMQISHANNADKWRIKGKSSTCRFGVNCVRRDCTFQHPDGWNPKGNSGEAGDEFAPSRMVCRSGRSCMRSDCYFSHPDGRDIDKTSKPTTFADSDDEDEVPKKPNKSEAKQTTIPKKASTAEDGEDEAPVKASKKKEKRATPKPVEESAPSRGPCRNGRACTRPDCHFDHPEGKDMDKTATAATFEVFDEDEDEAPKKPKKKGAKQTTMYEKTITFDDSEEDEAPATVVKKKAKQNALRPEEEAGDEFAPATVVKKKTKKAALKLEEEHAPKRKKKKAASEVEEQEAAVEDRPRKKKKAKVLEDLMQAEVDAPKRKRKKAT
jgi:hypothetical protein